MYPHRSQLRLRPPPPPPSPSTCSSDDESDFSSDEDESPRLPSQQHSFSARVHLQSCPVDNLHLPICRQTQLAAYNFNAQQQASSKRKRDSEAPLTPKRKREAEPHTPPPAPKRYKYDPDMPTLNPRFSMHVPQTTNYFEHINMSARESPEFLDSGYNTAASADTSPTLSPVFLAQTPSPAPPTTDAYVRHYKASLRNLISYRAPVDDVERRARELEEEQREKEWKIFLRVVKDGKGGQRLEGVRKRVRACDTRIRKVEGGGYFEMRRA